MLTENYSGSRSPLLPAGGRTSLHLSGPVPRESILVQTSELNRTIDYPARDMTITVEAGMRLEELQEQLAQEQQRLPIDIPQQHRATIGGAIASNTSGPGRFGYGTFRDYVIGISAVDGQGRLFSAGGRVVKNVAGYDLCKLLTGSRGTLAVITQVTLKLKPVVECRRLVLISAPSISTMENLLEKLNTSETRPVVIDLLNPKAVGQVHREARLDLPVQEYLLCLGYEGNAETVRWELETVQRELSPFPTSNVAIFSGETADRFWQALTEYQAASDDPLTFQVSVLPSRVTKIIEQAGVEGIAVQAHAGNGILIGHLPDRCSDAPAASELLTRFKQTVNEHQGSFSLLNCDAEWKPQLMSFCTPVPELELHRRMKQAFDPANLLSPGRLWST